MAAGPRGGAPPLGGLGDVRSWQERGESEGGGVGVGGGVIWWS